MSDLDPSGSVYDRDTQFFLDSLQSNFELTVHANCPNEEVCELGGVVVRRIVDLGNPKLMRFTNFVLCANSCPLSEDENLQQICIREAVERTAIALGSDGEIGLI